MNGQSLASTCCPSFLRAALGRVERSPIGSRLAKGMFWVAAGAVISRGLMLAASVLVARMLGRTGYGELGMIRSTVGMFGVFAGFGLGLTATRHVAQFRLSDPDRAGRIIGLSAMFAVVTGGLMALVLFAFAPWLAAHTINAPHLAGPLRISALMLFIDALNGAQTGALAGFEAFRTIARVNSLAGLVSFPILLIGVRVAGLSGALWALTLSLAINWLLNHLALSNEARRHGVTVALRGCGRERGILWSFSLPAALSAAMVAPVNWVCGALLVNRPEGYAEMGIFNAANQWYAMLLFLPGLLGAVVLPVLSDRLACQDWTASVKTLRFAVKTNALVVFPLVLLASLASPYLMRLYGETFTSGWPTLIAVLLTAGLLSIQMPVGQVIVASGRIWTGLLMNLGWAITFIGSTLLLLGFGAFGLAGARAASYVVHAIWTFAFVAVMLVRRRDSCVQYG